MKKQDDADVSSSITSAEGRPIVPRNKPDIEEHNAECDFEAF